ncbi:TPA: L7Ae/L30e/S12e/Gadd45 family ribosomal protein [Streptococcus suis]
MTPEQKKLNLLGLAQRAGALITGDEMVEKAIKSGKKVLVVAANDLSPATSSRYEHLQTTFGLDMDRTFDSYAISQALGKKRSICAINNSGMIKTYLSY